MSHQHSIGLEASKGCDCGLGIDDIDHFFLQCTLFGELGQVLKQEVTNVWDRCETRAWWMTRGSLNVSVQLLLFPFAIDLLTYVECCDILSATFKVYQEQR